VHRRTAASHAVRDPDHHARVGDATSRPLRRRASRARPLAHRPADLPRGGAHPRTYESAGKRHDGGICREGSVELRGALLDLGMGLWLCEPTSRTYALSLKTRGKPAGIIACALARRANKIAFAMVRDQSPYDPDRWSR
jgi:hypothetical protein